MMVPSDKRLVSDFGTRNSIGSHFKQERDCKRETQAGYMDRSSVFGGSCSTSPKLAINSDPHFRNYFNSGESSARLKHLSSSG
jgi:hypothetical protein